jgi:hypothetical protein
MASWKELPPIAKFSIIAFVIALILGLMSLGAEGYGIYYAVGFMLPVSIDTIHGDRLWPSLILAGMAWSLGFLFAGLICQGISQRTKSRILLGLTYILILWIWDFIVWWAIIALKVVQ